MGQHGLDFRNRPRFRKQLVREIDLCRLDLAHPVERVRLGQPVDLVQPRVSGDSQGIVEMHDPGGPAPLIHDR